MIIHLNTASTMPIYLQLRNQIVTGIGRGELKIGERLPTVRCLAADAGVNTMTVNKTYQILRAEGFIEIDRRKGAVVKPIKDSSGEYQEKMEEKLELISAEACLKGLSKEEFLKICENAYEKMNIE